MINKLSNIISLYVPLKFSLLDQLNKPQSIVIKFQKLKLKLKYTALSEKAFWRMRGIGAKKHPELNSLLANLTKNDVFWDVGANIGQLTLFAGVVTKCDIYAFEIEPFTFSMLIDNINKNRLNNRIKALPFGLSDQPGFIPIYISDDSYTNIGRAVIHNENAGQKSNLILMKGD